MNFPYKITYLNPAYWQKYYLFSIIHNHLMKYPTPLNITYFWSFGLLSAVLLGNQIITGIILAMHYNPSVLGAFQSIEHIMRDVNYGWLLRNLHSNGASFFFFLVYIHIGRGFYYGSFNIFKKNIWLTGMIIFILMMATAFLGYVLPWGQMSFWGATVITNLFTAFPIVGDSIAKWLWGGFSVGNPTLNKFFSLHYILPFVLLVIVLLHIYLLHLQGSSNPLNFNSRDFIDFYPYFYVKDLFAVMILIFIFCFFISYIPNFLLHPDNYNIANALNTPEHIVPEWYFLPFYAVLRSVSNKLGGVILMFGYLILFAALPYILWAFWWFIWYGSYGDSSNTIYAQRGSFQYLETGSVDILEARRHVHRRWMLWLPSNFSFKYGVFSKFVYTVFVSSFLVLLYLGGQPIYIYYVKLSKICILIFFLTFVFIIYRSIWFSMNHSKTETLVPGWVIDWTENLQYISNESRREFLYRSSGKIEEFYQDYRSNYGILKSIYKGVFLSWFWGVSFIKNLFNKWKIAKRDGKGGF